MTDNSKIAWTDNTFNPWVGCLRVSPGCDNCYAAAIDKRFGGDHWSGDTLPRRTSEANWKKPLSWNRKAEKSGKRIKVFCASMADVFDNRVPEQWRADLFNLIKATPHLDWIILTKRIGNVQKMLPPDWGDGYPNVWLLITVVNQTEADRDIPKLLDTPAVVCGLSVEPQLGPIVFDQDGLVVNFIDWVICGAESGPGRRPFNETWARSLRDQCQETGTAFFLKQMPGNARKGVIETPILDGRTWTEFPA